MGFGSASTRHSGPNPNGRPIFPRSVGRGRSGPRRPPDPRRATDRTWRPPLQRLISPLIQLGRTTRSYPQPQKAMRLCCFEQRLRSHQVASVAYDRRHQDQRLLLSAQIARGRRTLGAVVRLKALLPSRGTIWGRRVDFCFRLPRRMANPRCWVKLRSTQYGPQVVPETPRLVGKRTRTWAWTWTLTWK